MGLNWMKGVDDGKPIFPTYIEAIVQALNNRYVVSGLDVSAGSGMQISVSAGSVIYGGQFYNVDSVTLNIAEESVHDVRYDLVVWDSFDNSVKIVQGSEWVSLPTGVMSKVPNTEETQIPIAIVRVRKGETQILDDDIFDVKLGAKMFNKYTIVTVASDYSAKNGDIVLADASGGSLTVTLPEPVAGYDVIVKKVDGSANSVLVNSVNGEYIDDVTQLDLGIQGEAYRLVGDGVKWNIV